MKILVLNGPNLNLLGEREPNIYGDESMQSINDEMVELGRTMGYEVEYFQNNAEGRLIDRLQEARLDCAGVIFNAGAYTHYSYALRDAIASIKIPVVEVHMSNVDNREDFRKISVIAPVCRGSISGFGKYSYYLAFYALNNILGEGK